MLDNAYLLGYAHVYIRDLGVSTRLLAHNHDAHIPAIPGGWWMTELSRMTKIRYLLLLCRSVAASAQWRGRQTRMECERAPKRGARTDPARTLAPDPAPTQIPRARISWPSVSAPACQTIRECCQLPRAYYTVAVLLVVVSFHSSRLIVLLVSWMSFPSF